MRERIPYDEQAKICAMRDLKEFEKIKRQEEAVKVFNDIRDFFESSDSIVYLTTVLSKENLLTVLEEIQAIFEEIEDYERCQYVVQWKKTVNDIH